MNTIHMIPLYTPGQEENNILRYLSGKNEIKLDISYGEYPFPHHESPKEVPAIKGLPKSKKLGVLKFSRKEPIDFVKLLHALRVSQVTELAIDNLSTFDGLEAIPYVQRYKGFSEDYHELPIEKKRYRKIVELFAGWSNEGFVAHKTGIEELPFNAQCFLSILDGILLDSFRKDKILEHIKITWVGTRACDCQNILNYSDFTHPK